MNFNLETETLDDKKKKVNIWKWVALGVIALVILVIGILFFVSDETLEKFGISPSIFDFGKTVYGDVNDDGIVNSEDALIALQYATGDKEVDDDIKKVADVDGNGSVDRLDVQLILKKASNKINKFPIEEGAYGFKAGDVNQDGNINSNDSQYILDYLSGKFVLTEYQQVLADVSGDSQVTQLDSDLILNYSNKKVNCFPILDSKCKYYTLGDVNEDGTINSADASAVQSFVSGQITLTAIQQVAADVNGDGKITNDDAALISQVSGSGGTVDFSTNVNTNTNVNSGSNTTTGSSGSVGINPGLTNPPSVSIPSASAVPAQPTIIYGDVDGDGTVTAKDAALILQYSAGQRTLTEYQIKCGDIDGNGKAEPVDAELISKYLANIISKLDPSITYYTLGDVNGDGSIGNADANLILKYYTDSVKLDEVQKKAADYNCDGKINTIDAQQVLRVASGQ